MGTMFSFFNSNYSHKNKNKGQLLKCNKKTCENTKDKIETLYLNLLQK
jgi:hypothetical protein